MGQHVQAEQESGFRIARIHADSGHTRHIRPEMVGTVDAGMKWTFAGDKATLSARCSDIFNTSMPECNLRYGGQDVRMENSFYLRTFTLNFSFRFGGYKKKEIKEVDTSRFRH